MDREVEVREFVSARGAALSRAAYLLTGDHQAAEDLVQDTYVIMVRRWQKAGSLDPEAYVRRILYSRFVDGWRRRRLLELPWASPPDTAGGDEAGQATDRLTLEGALNRLTPRQRAVLVLRFYEDLTEAQAAAALQRNLWLDERVLRQEFRQEHSLLARIWTRIGLPMFGHTLMLADPYDSGTERGAILTKVTGQAPAGTPCAPPQLLFLGPESLDD